MLDSSRRRIDALPDDALVLDVGGWASPLGRADWVLDLAPYETRGLYGSDDGPERFSADTWVRLDICARDPWPFEEDQFDFVVCSHTLEDVRDPVWVCSELNRVGRAGYLEVPSRLEEQTPGLEGPWVGYTHHRWLVDVDSDTSHVSFVHKPGMLQHRESARFPGWVGRVLTADERVQTCWWRDGFTFEERHFTEPAELDAYLDEFVTERLPGLADRRPPRPGRRRLRWRRPPS